MSYNSLGYTKQKTDDTDFLRHLATENYYVAADDPKSGMIEIAPKNFHKDTYAFKEYKIETKGQKDIGDKTTMGYPSEKMSWCFLSSLVYRLANELYN